MTKYVGIALSPTNSGPVVPGSHDIFLDETNNLSMVYDSEAIGQLAKERLLTYRNEWELNRSAGIPWFQQIFVRPFNQVVAEAIIKRAILQTKGVRELQSFELNVNFHTRHADVPVADILTEFDEVVSI